MRLPSPTASPIIFTLLALLMLLPAGGVRAFEGHWHLSEAARHAHSTHERLIAQAAEERERLIAEAEALRARALAEAMATRDRLWAQAREDRARLMAQSRAAKRRVEAERRQARRARRQAERQRAQRQAARQRARLEISFHGVYEATTSTTDFDLTLEASADEAPMRMADACESSDTFDDTFVPPLEAIEPPAEIFEAPDDLEEVPMVPELSETEVELVVDEMQPQVALVDDAQPEERPALGGDYEGVEWAIIERINAIRARRGLRALTYDARLQAGAINHSAEMFHMNYFSHTSPVSEHADFATRIRNEGIADFGAAGENLVMGPDSEDLAERFVQIWMDSPGHRANILGEDFHFTGVGVYGEGARVYATQLFSQRVVRAAE